MTEINEVQFTANVKWWIDEICREQIAVDPSFPFSGAAIEDRTATKGKRRDLILRPNRDPKGIALTGEVKLPDRPDGRSPYDENLVDDAALKAGLVGSEHFFTWNVNRFVLWRTFERGTRLMDRAVDFWDWMEISDSDTLALPENEAVLKRRWEDFLLYYAEIYKGARPFPRRPLDQQFVHRLESALDAPTMATRAEIHRRYGTVNGFKRDLDDWVKRSLGATISESEQEDNLKRAAKFSCYVLANRIVFHDALRRKYADRLKQLSIPRTIKTGAALRERLEAAFDKAEKVTEDYETVFRGERFGDGLPFINDAAVDAWRDLIADVDAYDFTKLDYDIIGQIFERLISPAERHRFGQHYTKSEIVDLINAFCIRSARDKVLDPSCGGGTFLIRAYARKKWLAERERQAISHETFLSELYGADLSAYAVHLSTIGLATRDLVRSANYPRIACADFFDVRNGKSLFPIGPVGPSGESVSMALPEIDAAVGNPPYIRQELIPPEQKVRCRDMQDLPWRGTRLSGRSDIHVYFWLRAAAGVKPGGYLAFLTSSSWLDVEYGFHLQRWILEHFAIEAIFESSVEPWFTDARVATAATILRREPDQDKRLDNLARFVQVRKPLADILLDYERGDDRIEAAERIRDFIGGLKKNVESENWRVRIVRQRDLINRSALRLENENDDGPSSSEAEEVKNGGDPASRHIGGKWGIHLRAPDIFFEMLDRFGDRLTPLGELAEVRFGVKSGCDAFFYPRDVTDDRLSEYGEKKFKEIFGLTKKEAEKVRVCKVVYEGRKSDVGRNVEQIHLVEARFLAPEVHSIMGMETRVVDPTKLGRKILLVREKKSAIRGTHALKYIQWGEKQGFHRKPTCAAREPARPWYDLAPRKGALVLWPKAHQYAHASLWNPGRMAANCRLYEVYPDSSLDPLLLSAVLNSTIVALTKYLFGRQVGREGNLDTEVIDANMMLIPDPRRFDRRLADRIKKVFPKFAKAPIRNLPDEFKDEARRTLDLLVIRGMGCSKKEAEDLLQKLYESVRSLYAEIRKLELIAQGNRLKAARRGKNTPQSLAAEIWDYYIKEAETPPPRFPSDYLPPIGSPKSETLDFPEGAAKEEEMFGSIVVSVGKEKFDVGDPHRAELLMALSEEGFSGEVALPESPKECRSILSHWRDDRARLNAKFEELTIERTTDRKQIQKVVADLWRRYRRWSIGQD